MASLDACTAAGYTPFVDSTSGIVLYCLDLNGNVVDVPTSTPSPTTPSPGGSTNWLGDISVIENDVISGFRAFTQPQLPPGQIGVQLTGGSGGATLSGSPILLIALLALVYLLVEKA